jgi:hypothetical protein
MITTLVMVAITMRHGVSTDTSDVDRISNSMPGTWFPPYWLVFIMHGPPASPLDSSIFRAAISNGPTIKEQPEPSSEQCHGA